MSKANGTVRQRKIFLNAIILYEGSETLSEIQFLASSKHFIIPKEIDENGSTIFENGLSFGVHTLDEYWVKIVQPIFTMPYLYEARGLGNRDFWIYLDKYMELGDVLELYTIPVQHWYKDSLRKLRGNPNHITINIGNYTYENEYGLFKLTEKSWLEELKHRTLVTEFGITKVLYY